MIWIKASTTVRAALTEKKKKTTFWPTWFAITLALYCKAYYCNCEQIDSSFIWIRVCCFATKICHIVVFLTAFSPYIHPHCKKSHHPEPRSHLHFSISPCALQLSRHSAVWSCCLVWPTESPRRLLSKSLTAGEGEWEAPVVLFVLHLHFFPH